MNQPQYLMTDFSAPNLMRIHAHLTASMPSRIMEMPRTSQIWWFLGDQLLFVVDDEAFVEVVLLAVSVDCP